MKEFCISMSDALVFFCNSITFDSSTLDVKIDKGNWLGNDIPSLRFGNVEVRLYFIGDYAFKLGRNTSKTAAEKELKKNPALN